MCHQQKWHHRKSPLLFLVLSSIPKQTKTFPTAKRHKSTLNEKIPKGDFRGPRLTSNGRSRFVWNLYARTTLCKWIHKHWICKHALGLKIATKMSHWFYKIGKMMWNETFSNHCPETPTFFEVENETWIPKPIEFVKESEYPLLLDFIACTATANRKTWISIDLRIPVDDVTTFFSSAVSRKKFN